MGESPRAPAQSPWPLPAQVVCTLVAAFLHFFFLSSFCWVLTEAWQSYMAVTGRLRSRLVRKRFLCLGWGEQGKLGLGCEGGLWLGLLGYVRVGSGLGLVTSSEGTWLERRYTVGWGRQSIRVAWMR